MTEEKVRTITKIGQDTAIPLSALAFILMIASSFFSDHAQVKALSEQMKESDIQKVEQAKLLQNLDKKVTVIMFHFKLRLPDDSQ